MGFPRQECWSGLPSSSPGIEPEFPVAASGFFTTSATSEFRTKVCLLLSLRPGIFCGNVLCLCVPVWYPQYWWLLRTRNDICVTEDISCFFKIFLYVWLCWILVAAASLAVASRGCSLVAGCGLLTAGAHLVAERCL